ncbi:hypothetical protein ILYODFUR_023108 [Ilyodon furcidens]|uniref:BED-type domain-containing protein n=1 Tax=Ilyodon furcidens TaxID=33524 RepID=A0ABV0SQT0_9TELE
MSYRKLLKVWLHFSKCDAYYAHCNICDAMFKPSSRNTSNFRTHLVKHQIFLEAEEAQFLSGSDLRLQLLPSALLARLHPLAARLQPETWLGFNLCIIKKKHCIVS